MQPYLAGAVYVNYTSDQGDELLTAAYPTLIRERLAALKSKYDPTNFFRLNQNVGPAVWPSTPRPYHIRSALTCR